MSLNPPYLPPRPAALVFEQWPLSRPWTDARLCNCLSLTRTLFPFVAVCVRGPFGSTAAARSLREAQTWWAPNLRLWMCILVEQSGPRTELQQREPKTQRADVLLRFLKNTSNSGTTSSDIELFMRLKTCKAPLQLRCAWLCCQPSAFFSFGGLKERYEKTNGASEWRVCDAVGQSREFGAVTSSVKSSTQISFEC